MRTIFRSLAVALMSSVLFYGCSKDDDSNNTTPQSKTQLLTAHSWKLTGSKLNGVDDFSTIDACDLDDIATFLSNGTGNLDEGATKCDPADPQTSPITWSFQSNETILSIDYGGGLVVDATIVALTTDQLKLTYSYSYLGATFNIEKTFGKP